MTPNMSNTPAGVANTLSSRPAATMKIANTSSTATVTVVTSANRRVAVLVNHRERPLRSRSQAVRAKPVFTPAKRAPDQSWWSAAPRERITDTRPQSSTRPSWPRASKPRPKARRYHPEQLQSA